MVSAEGRELARQVRMRLTGLLEAQGFQVEVKQVEKAFARKDRAFLQGVLDVTDPLNGECHSLVHLCGLKEMRGEQLLWVEAGVPDTKRTKEALSTEFLVGGGWPGGPDLAETIQSALIALAAEAPAAETESFTLLAHGLSVVMAP